MTVWVSWKGIIWENTLTEERTGKNDFNDNYNYYGEGWSKHWDLNFSILNVQYECNVALWPDAVGVNRRISFLWLEPLLLIVIPSNRSAFACSIKLSFKSFSKFWYNVVQTLLISISFLNLYLGPNVKNEKK